MSKPVAGDAQCPSGRRLRPARREPGEPTMELVVCPHCETRVLPMSNGHCPACRQGLDGPLDQAPERPDHREDWGEELPATDFAGPVSLATIRTFLFNADAELARDYLEKQGIPAFLANAEIVAMNWILANAIGFIR